MQVWDKKWSEEQIEMLNFLVDLIEKKQYKDSFLYAKKMIANSNYVHLIQVLLNYLIIYLRLKLL